MLIIKIRGIGVTGCTCMYLKVRIGVRVAVSKVASVFVMLKLVRPCQAVMIGLVLRISPAVQ